MKQPSYTKQQIEKLVKNKNVLRFNGKYFAYTADFKIRAVDQYLNEGMSPPEIFKEAGFDLKAIGKFRPRYLLHDWVHVLRAKGIDGFTTEQRGKGLRQRRHKEFAKLTDEEKIKKLELEVVYLKKENDFLVRLRAKRAE